MLRFTMLYRNPAAGAAGAVRRPAGAPRGDVGPEVASAATRGADEVLRDLASRPGGLTDREAAARLELGGANALTEPPRRPAAVRLALCFASPFTLILAVLAAIELYLDVIRAAPGEADPSTCIVIAVMVAVSGLLRFAQEDRGMSAAEALRDLTRTTCRVVRSGSAPREIDPEALVPGDVVELGAGDLVPADCRVLGARDLFVSQAALTGESAPVEKAPAALAAAPSIPECANILFTGTSVVSGTARAVVVATGDGTYLGGVAGATARTGKTAFDRGIAQVSRVLAGLMLVMCPVVLAVDGITKGDWAAALVFAASVAVGITPQMLPAIVTACLARGARTMARHEVIVKNINAIQDLGAMDVLCCDKTGTLTENEVVLERHLDVEGRPDARVLRHALLNSYFQTGVGNLVDRAVIERSRDGGEVDFEGVVARYRKVDELPFDFDRRLMSVVVADGSGKTQMITKGAVEEVLAACTHAELGSGVVELDEALREGVRERVGLLNREGMRVVAVAQRSDPPRAGELSARDERGMVLIGYLAFLDPPKESAAGAVARLRAAGVEVKVLTGDAEGVAAAVCRAVGIPVEGTLLGPDIDAMDDAELARRAEGAQLFARLSPMQKARVAGALRHAGAHVVGFMGDGINDAAAMRASDVGISVDAATDVARETADIILARKDLAVLCRGVLEGRRTHGNTMKYIKVTASSNFGNVLSVLAASALLPFLPMTPLQLLLLGLVYTVSCAAIPWDRVDASFTGRPHAWDARSIVRFMVFFGPMSTVFDLVTYAAMFLAVAPAALGGGWAAVSAAGGAGAREAFAAVFQTGWFVESMWTQALVLLALRSDRGPVRGAAPHPALLAVTVAGAACATVLPYWGPAARALGLVPLPAGYYLLLAACVAGYLALVTVAKRLYVARFGGLL